MKKMKPTFKELLDEFPPEEASRAYTYEELLRLHEENKHRKIVPVNNDQLMSTYVKSIIGGGRRRRNTTKKNKSRRITKRNKRSNRSRIVKHPSFNKKYIGGGAFQLSQFLKKMPAAHKNDICNDLVIESVSDFDKLKDTHPELEEYLNDDYQHLTPLKSYPFIFGMQTPQTENCDKLLQFFRFLASKGIRRYVCLLCENSEPIVWNIVKKEYPSCVFFNHEIEDYRPFTFNNAMSILAHVVLDKSTPIVFHCGAGHGRTGAVLYLILQYMRCVSNRNLLRRPLMKSKSNLTHTDLEKTFLCQEYSFDAAEEFYESIDKGRKERWPLRTERLNIINQVIANTLQVHHPTETQVAYMQFNEFEDLSNQSLYFANPLPSQVRQHIISVKRAEEEMGSFFDIGKHSLFEQKSPLLEID